MRPHAALYVCTLSAEMDLDLAAAAAPGLARAPADGPVGMQVTNSLPRNAGMSTWGHTAATVLGKRGRARYLSNVCTLPPHSSVRLAVCLSSPIRSCTAQAFGRLRITSLGSSPHQHPPTPPASPCAPAPCRCGPPPRAAPRTASQPAPPGPGQQPDGVGGNEGVAQGRGVQGRGWMWDMLQVEQGRSRTRHPGAAQPPARPPTCALRWSCSDTNSSSEYSRSTREVIWMGPGGEGAGTGQAGMSTAASDADCGVTVCCEAGTWVPPTRAWLGPPGPFL